MSMNGYPNLNIRQRVLPRDPLPEEIRIAIRGFNHQARQAIMQRDTVWIQRPDITDYSQYEEHAAEHMFQLLDMHDRLKQDIERQFPQDLWSQSSTYHSLLINGILLKRRYFEWQNRDSYAQNPNYFEAFEQRDADILAASMQEFHRLSQGRAPVMQRDLLALTSAQGFENAHRIMRNVVVVGGLGANPVAVAPEGGFMGDLRRLRVPPGTVLPPFQFGSGNRPFAPPPPPQPRRQLEGNGRANSDEKECSICIGDVKPGTPGWTPHFNTPCGHTFHTPCLQQWIQTGASNCPMCKRELFES